MNHPDGRRDLALIRASGSTARVLNLALIYERFGQSEEYLNNPLFANRRLNRALIVKHVLRSNERDLFARPTISATKVILPYATDELTLGGVSFMVDEDDFERIMAKTVGGYADAAAMRADLELLRILASVPSFDPFLMRERLRHAGLEPARCYFDIAEADVVRMRAFVGKEIAELINLAFATGGSGAGELSQRLADKLMTDETAKALDPLRETLRLSGEEYVEGVFAWKGFLYYRWLMDEVRPSLAEFIPRFAGLKVVRSDLEERRELASQRRAIIDKMRAAIARVDETLLDYGAAFASLTDGQPAAFRTFLLKAPSLFIPIGEAVGVVRHILSFWGYRFPGGGTAVMDGDEAIELLCEFEHTLAGVTFAQDYDVAA